MGRGIAIAGHLIGAAIGLILLIAAVAKAREHQETTQALAWLVGGSFAPAAVVVIIVLEAGLGVALVVGVAPLNARLAAAALFLAFAAWGIAMWLGHAPERCGCGLKFLPLFSRVDAVAVIIRGFSGFGLCLLAACAARYESQRNCCQEIGHEDQSVGECV